MQSALIISADSDLVPAVRVAHEVNPRLFVSAAFPPKRYSNELKQLMKASFQIGSSKIRSSQLPDSFTAPNRTTFQRPTNWC